LAKEERLSGRLGGAGGEIEFSRRIIIHKSVIVKKNTQFELFLMSFIFFSRRDGGVSFECNQQRRAKAREASKDGDTQRVQSLYYCPHC
jgi:hypothetical protein